MADTLTIFMSSFFPGRRGVSRDYIRYPRIGRAIRPSRRPPNCRSRHTTTVGSTKSPQHLCTCARPADDGRIGRHTAPKASIRTHVSQRWPITPAVARRSASDRRQRAERTDGGKNFLEQTTRHHDLGHLEGDGPAMANDPRVDLHQPLAQRGHRPEFRLGGQGLVSRSD